MNPFYKNLSLWIVIIIFFTLLTQIFNQGPISDQRSYSEFLQLVETGQIKSVEIQGQQITAETIDQNKKIEIYAPNDVDLLKILRERNVAITAKPPAKQPWFLSALINMFPVIILIGIWIFFMRQMQGGGGKAMSFGKSRARLLNEDQTKVTFKDVAGVEEAKDELAEVVEFLREPQKFTRLGGRIPKGVLLVGSPGTGKTLLARAIAGEAEVPFYTISGSDFVEMFVGVGASRVRDLFAQAKKSAPCIVFIDEIDAVGRQRGAGLGGGHDEREQTLNQLLVEMDGFESNEGVILISATNRPDVLDPALLRPGRFDRQVVVDMPDINGREGILKVHMNKTPLADDVDVKSLAKGTPGFSGADLENMVNEAALLAAKRDQEKLRMVDFEDAKDKVYMGLERKSKVTREDDRKTTAYHEAGHALVARFLPEMDAVNKITIIPRGRAAGVTWFLPEERDFRYKDQLQSELAVAYGGRVAEEIIFKRISTGASNDIKTATGLASKMVRNWGMSEELGPISFEEGQDQVFLGRDIGQSRDYSEQTAQKIDKEISDLINNSYMKAKDILIEYLDVLHALSNLLLEKETIMGKELDELILKVRPGIELPKAGLSDEDNEKNDSEKESDEKTIETTV